MNFFKSALYVLAANAVVLLLSLLLRPLVARVLGPSEYGIFALVLSTATVLQAFILFSLNSGVLYYTARNPEKKREIVSSVLAFTVLSSILLFIPLQYVVLLLAPSLGPVGYAVSFLLSLALSFFTVSQAAQQGLQKFGEYSKYGIFSSLLAGLLTLALAVFMRDGALSALARAAAVFAVSLAALSVLGAIGRPDLRALKKVLSYSSPLGVAGLVAAFIAVVDRYFLAAYRSTAEVGYYDISYAMVAAVLPFSSSLLTIMMPRVIQNQQNLGLYYKKLGQANTIILSAIGLFFYYSDIIVTLLLGSPYQPAAFTFKIISFALPLMAFYGLNGASLDAVAKTKMSGLLASLLTVFSIIFNFLLVPRLGAVGAAFANFLTYVAVVSIGFCYLYGRRSVDLGPSLRQYAVFFVFAAAYFLFLEKGGFAVKTALYALFLAVSFAVNRPLVAEAFGQARGLLRK